MVYMEYSVDIEYSIYMYIVFTVCTIVYLSILYILYNTYYTMKAASVAFGLHYARYRIVFRGFKRVS